MDSIQWLAGCDRKTIVGILRALTITCVIASLVSVLLLALGSVIPSSSAPSAMPTPGAPPPRESQHPPADVPVPTANVLQRSEAEAASDESLRLTLTGRCIAAENGTPLQGCLILFRDEEHNRALQVDTGVDGKFLVRNTACAMACIDVRGEGRMPLQGHFPVKEPLTDLGDIELQLGHEVRGSVVDSNGNGIAAMHVSAGYFRRDLNGDQAMLTTDSDSDGNFYLGLMPAGQMIASVDAAGVRVPFTVDPSASITWLRLVVAQRRTCVRGVVLDTSGTPIVNARLNLLDHGMVSTAADGSFEFVNWRVPLAQAYLKVLEAPGFEVGQMITTHWGTENLRVVLSRTRSVTLQVRDETGAPVEGYSVWLGHPTNYSKVERQRRAGGPHHDGLAKVEDVRRGDNVLRVFPDSPSLRPSAPIALQVTDADNQLLQVTVQSMRQCEVQCVDDRGHPMPAMLVELLDLAGDPSPIGDRVHSENWRPDGGAVLVLATGKTNAEGIACVFAPHDLRYSALSIASTPPVLVEVPDLSPERPLRIIVSSTSRIEGVVRAVPSDKQIEVRAMNARNQCETRVVDDAGAFQFKDLAPGRYELRLAVAERNSASRAGILLDSFVRVVEVHAGDTCRVELVVPEISYGSLRGFVIVTGSLPAGSRAQLRRVNHGGISEPVPIGQGGMLVFQSVLSGRYQLELSFPSTTTMLRPVPVLLPDIVEIPSGGLVTHDFSFKVRRLVVHVWNPDGTPFEKMCVLRQGEQAPVGITIGALAVLEPAPVLPLCFGEGPSREPIWSEPIIFPDGEVTHEVAVTVPALR